MQSCAAESFRALAEVLLLCLWRPLPKAVDTMPKSHFYHYTSEGP